MALGLGSPQPVQPPITSETERDWGNMGQTLKESLLSRSLEPGSLCGPSSTSPTSTHSRCSVCLDPGGPMAGGVRAKSDMGARMGCWSPR